VADKPNEQGGRRLVEGQPVRRGGGDNAKGDMKDDIDRDTGTGVTLFLPIRRLTARYRGQGDVSDVDAISY
jgi:hypothetical protein